jgi:phosphoribosylformylglycinamidine cyclo-ligase
MTDREPRIPTESRSNGLTYRDAGVDIDVKAQAIERLTARARDTLGTAGGPIGQFGGTYRIPAGPDQVLVASADGIGTKLRLAFVLGGDAHAGMGRDIVNHCVNDILALGARPLFFMDYFATGRLDPEVVTAVVGGVTDACLENGMALLGGETAEMPDMYATGEYDLAGFIVGTVAPEAMIDGAAIAPGDAVIGLPSTGLHTNGFSLARRALGLTGTEEMDRVILSGVPDGWSESVGLALLAGHRSYLAEVQPLLADGLVRGMAHITGGGLIDNLPRVLPEATVAHLEPASWERPPIFDLLIERGGIPEDEWHRVFNMGVGFVLIARPAAAVAILERMPAACQIGEIAPRASRDEAPVQGLGLG